MKMKKLNKHILTAVITGSLLSGAPTTFAAGLTSSGLDIFSKVVQRDGGLRRNTTPRARKAAVAASNAMHAVILEGIYQTGVANDGKISTADARELNDYIYANFHRPWVVLHGDDKKNKSWGFHKVVNDGARTRLFNKNAINTVGDGIYHLGYASHIRNKLLNEDGNANQTYKDVGKWMNALLKDDLKALENPAVKEVEATSNTGLDQIVDIIKTDSWVRENASTGDIRKGIKAINALNEILLEAIDATNVAEDGNISVEDAKTLNEYLVANHLDEWEKQHGDTKTYKDVGYRSKRPVGSGNKHPKSGFHLVQRVETYRYGKGIGDEIGESVYHLGFPSDHEHLGGRKGGTVFTGKGSGYQTSKKNVDMSGIYKNSAKWLNQLLASELSEMKMTTQTENSPVDDYSSEKSCS